MDLLQSELAKLVVADPTTEVARNATLLATTELRRILVEQRDVPQFREAALSAYRALLPEVRREVPGPASDQFDQVLEKADSSNWDTVEAVLAVVAAALFETGQPSASQLAGRLVAIDAGLRDAKEGACEALSQPRKPRSHTSAAQTDSTAELDRLVTFIRRAFPTESTLEVDRVEQIPGGYSKHTLFIYLRNNEELPDCIVMRRDGPFLGGSVVTEFPTIQRMYESGVAVPKPFAMDATGEVYGKPFILVERAPGAMIGDFVVIKDPSEAVALDLAAKMARLHATSFTGIEHVLVGGSTSITERLLGEIDACETTWRSVNHQKSYVVDTAITWLKRNIHLAEGPRTVLHRDIGFHNMMVHNNAVSAFLDWETAAVGTAAEDVGYTYDSVRQMTDWNTFLSAYETAANTKLDRRQLNYYILWGSVRIVVPISKGVDPVFAGTRRNLSEYYLGDHIVHVLIQRIAHQLSRILT